MKNKICGIYKITSPSGKIYIGQSKDIEKRHYNYKKYLCKTQTILYNSFLKHGVENHNFEIIEECDQSQLNELEAKYIKEYKSFAKDNSNGMNCTIGGLGQKGVKMPKHVLEILIHSHRPLSDKHKMAISVKLKGRKLSEEQILCLKNRVISEETREKLRFAAQHMTQEHKDKISIANKGRAPSQKTIDAIIKANTGRKKTQKELEEQSKRMIGNQYTKGMHISEEHKRKIGDAQKRGKHHMARMVIDLSSGFTYDCLVDLCSDKKLQYGTIYAQLTGKNTNKTQYEFV